MTSTPEILHFVIDAAAAFPYNSQVPFSSRSQSTAEWATTPDPAEALACLPEEERERVLKYLRPADAALSLASFLLKHLAISRICNVSWSEAVITQTRTIRNGKPFFEPGGIEFNVSHHGELAVLAAVQGSEIKVGIDIVHANVQKDLPGIRKAGGWKAWTDVFVDAFSDGEMRAIQGAIGEGDDWRRADVAEKCLRVFYTYWALKEAYIKMTSDAFMAAWLRQLEFRNVRVPGLPQTSSDVQLPSYVEGEAVMGIGIWLYGKPVEDARIQIQALNRDYMVATATSRPVRLSAIQRLHVRNDITPLSREMGEI